MSKVITNLSKKLVSQLVNLVIPSYQNKTLLLLAHVLRKLNRVPGQYACPTNVMVTSQNVGNLLNNQTELITER